ncbi:DUF262 domain-containing protein [Aeromonas veronii]|uniref:DUF262 domain-containing protein n=1 Tax=Aeromonas veronii TaxID=654 RepID=UPI00226CDC61|nr:DUF262 domain-containing HNH endonuclease family protein [Aeromonas veronii]MCX9103774.1 DUF262 domain-containing HNH endonuclease family protein [Aeromonas veronii]MCX9119425.1 DUF262 domain-containing HNH endonuclease family protein [Aeromonas veronii]
MKNPDKNNIHDTFDGSVRYSAPVYQRYYVWSYDNLQALLDDIENATDENSVQFIGATVVQDYGKRGGTKSPNEYLIIDGQQRLTTIYLLIAGLVWTYREGKENDDAKTLAETYLAFSAGKHAGMPKLLPTLQDRHQLFDILENEIDCLDWNLSEINRDVASRRTGISTQWKNIKKHFKESFFNEEGAFLKEAVDNFQEKLLNNVEYVQITLEPNDDANTAFSKLNFMGEPLTIADLVRNDVFSRLNEDKTDVLDKFYEKHWKPFEKSFPGKSFEQYITIYSTIKFKGDVSKSKSFPQLQKSWEKMRPESIIADMKKLADIYISLVEYSPISDFDSQVNNALKRISFMPKTTVTWPYLIQLIDSLRRNKSSKKQVLDCLSLVESFLVRRAIVGLEPTGLHAVFKGLWNKAGADKIKLSEKIITTTIRCPDDEAVMNALIKDNMYSRQITKYLMIQREVILNQENGYDNAINDFSVEHVMPKNRIGHWAVDFSVAEHNYHLNAIGNLTPLTKGQNSKIKDIDWSEKRKIFKGSNWKVTQKLSAKAKWNIAQIENQNREFCKWVILTWPAVN